MEKSKGPAGPEEQDLRKYQENNNGKGKIIRNDSEEWKNVLCSWPDIDATLEPRTFLFDMF